MKVFFIYACVVALFVILVQVSLQLLHSKGIYLFIIRIYNISEYGLIAYFISTIIKSLLVRKIIRLSIIVFALYAMVDYFFTNQLKFNNHAIIVSSLSLIMILIYFFYEKMQTVFLYPLYQSITFWICVGFFLYFTGNFFFFLFTNYSSDKAFLNQMRIIYGLVTITKNIVLSMALLATEHVETNSEELLIPRDLQLDEFTLNPTKP